MHKLRSDSCAMEILWCDFFWGPNPCPNLSAWASDTSNHHQPASPWCHVTRSWDQWFQIASTASTLKHGPSNMSFLLWSFMIHDYHHPNPTRSYQITRSYMIIHDPEPSNARGVTWQLCSSMLRAPRRILPLTRPLSSKKRCIWEVWCLWACR